MKKVLFIAAAVAAMAACTKSEVVYDDNDAEIGLSPVNYMTTKTVYGPYSAPNYNDDEQFKVWAEYTPNEPGTEFRANTNDILKTYLDEVTFAKKTELLVWGGHPNPYYWPKSGSLYFAGYSPAEISLDGDAEYEFNVGGSKMTLPGFTQNDYSGICCVEEIETNTNYKMVDLMYFDVKPSTESVNSTIPTVLFKHALSWVTIRVACAANFDELFKINKITLNDISFKETFTSGAGDPWNSPSWTANKSNVKDLVVYDAQFSDHANVTTDDPILNHEKYLTVEGLLLIPQAVTSVEIEYEQKANVSQAFVPQNPKTVTLAGATTGSDQSQATINTWEIGKHYTYTLLMEANEILVYPQVDTWIPEIVNAIEVK